MWTFSRLAAVVACLGAAPALADGISFGVGGTFGDGVGMGVGGSTGGGGSNLVVLVADGTKASLDLSCTTNQAYNNGVQTTPAALVTVTRATSSAVGSYVDDLSGNWTRIADNVLRVSNKGCLIEEQRTQTIRNNSMQGAVVGTPGTLPTNWAALNPISLAANVIGTGTENGVDYIDLQIVGTTSGTIYRLAFDTAAVILAGQAQTWTTSFFSKVVGGSLTNVSNMIAGFAVYDSGPALLAAMDTTGGLPATSGTLGALRSQGTSTVSQSTAASLRPYIGFTVTNGAAINFTIRIGWPQLERALNTQFAVATGAQTVTNNGTGTCVSGTYTVSGGTGTSATMTGVATAGVITSLTTLAVGAYTAFPTSPAALTGTACSGSPTVTLTAAPAGAAQGFATSPVRTTTVAVLRGSDVARVTGVTGLGAASSIYAAGTPMVGATPGNVLQGFASLDNASVNNRLVLYRHGPSLAATGITGSGGVAGGAMTGAAWAVNTPGKLAAASASADQAMSFNGAAVQTAASTWPPSTTPTQLSVGTTGGTATWNGYITRLSAWYTTRVTNAGLQTLTAP